MRPSSEWEVIVPGWAPYLRAHGVRVKMRWDHHACCNVAHAPTWAVTIAYRARVGDPRRRRALRRAVKEPEFRLALLAAIDAGIERAFLETQEMNIDE